MVKRSTSSKAQAPLVQQPAAKGVLREREPAPVLVPPSVQGAPLLDLMCSHFLLTLATQQSPRLNVRRDLNTLLALTGRHWVWPTTVLQRLRQFLETHCQGNDLWRDQAALDTGAFLTRHGTWAGPYEEGTLFFYLDEYAKQSPKDIWAVLTTTQQWLAQVLAPQRSALQDNVDTLAELLSLNPGERALLLYGALARYQRDLRTLLVEFKAHNAADAHAMFAQVAGVDRMQVAEALRTGSRLDRLGLLESLLPEHHITDLGDLMKISERLPSVLLRTYQHPQELMAVFARRAPDSPLTLDDFAFVADDARLLSQLLQSARRAQECGVNVLLYGPPGTGKTELARVAVRAAGLQLYEVESADREGHCLSGRERYRSLQVAQAFLQGAPNAALLFDEVEDVFPTESNPAGGKAWVNQLLEHNPVPTVWITNRIEHIDAAFRRRFAYHLELKSPPPGAREQLVDKALAGQPVSELLVQRLKERQGLTPAHIHTALRFAKLAQPEATTLDALIERQLAHADRAMGQAPAGAGRVHPVPYALEWLHTHSRYDLPRMAAALNARGHGALCLYGPPGTGKTAWAEHLAHTLQKPLMVRQASDLLSKYVGETEQQMAAMFAEAEAEQALLLLDEADTFLLDRRQAQRHHEVSEVNEMLQGMERFRGVFVCTTNLLDQIDPAALRRFSFKIQFLPLRPEQREALFTQEALPGGQRGPDNWRQRLQALDGLSLGDFAAIKRQADTLQETLSPLDWLEQLEQEHRLKPEGRQRSQMGFLAH
jgi:SpoVK/Ycf46/Vps4 family AAA+-type ATPase